MFDSPISKTQAQLVSAARAAASDYIQNGTDLTEAVVKSASALQPITSEHVRRICEMTYHDAYERLFAEKTGMLQYVSFDPPDAIRAAELLDALQLGVNQQHNFDKLASMTKEEKKRKRRNTLGGAALGGAIAYGTGRNAAVNKTIDKLEIERVGKNKKTGKEEFKVKLPKGVKDKKQFIKGVVATERLKRGLYGAALGAGAGAAYTYATRNKEASMNTTKQRLMNKQASAALGGSIGAGIGAIGGAMSGDKDSTTRQRLGRAIAGGAAGGLLGAGAGKLVSGADEVKGLQKTVGAKKSQNANLQKEVNQANKRNADSQSQLDSMNDTIKKQEEQARKQYDALSSEEKAKADARVEYFSPEATAKRKADAEKAKKNTPDSKPRVSKSVEVPVEEYRELFAKQQAAVAKRKKLEAIPNKTPEQQSELEAARKLSYDLSKQLSEKKPTKKQPTSMGEVMKDTFGPKLTKDMSAAEKRSNIQEKIKELERSLARQPQHLEKGTRTPEEVAAKTKALQDGIKRLENALSGLMKKEAGVSMPRKFQRMNTHELWTKAASGKELQDHNPTRSIQQVHRDLKDSISTVKSELYSAEHNEKLAMIDMVKQAKAGLSAGHSMEQVLHAAVSVVDATEPFMAKTAHDLCATIVEACADHQNSGFRKEAQIFMSPQEAIRRGRENDKAGRSVLGKMMGNHKKQAGVLQEVNPNHPIPQKFKKLAEANIQRKHLEVTLDELNRNMDYFNEQLKNELFR